MKSILAIGGVPASGKTTIVRNLMAKIGKDSFKTFQFGLLRGHFCFEKNLIVLGIYNDGETFAGTDRLSMAVIKDAKSFLISPMQNSWNKEETVLIFEGDRLFNKEFLGFCGKRFLTRVVVLTADETLLKERHANRNDRQKESWLAGRKTKVKNILEVFPEALILKNNTKDQTNKNLETIFDLISS